MCFIFHRGLKSTPACYLQKAFVCVPSKHKVKGNTPKPVYGLLEVLELEI